MIRGTPIGTLRWFLTAFRVRVRGLQELLKRMEDAPEKMKPALTRGLLACAARATEAVQDIIGVSYPPASVGGEPPHLRTGSLRRSVRIEHVDPSKPSVLMAVGGAGTGVPYAAALEFGTSDMEPRPYVVPVMVALAPEFPTILLDETDNALKEAFA